MSDNKLLVGILLGSVALITGGVFLTTKLGTPTNVKLSNNARAAVAVTTKDWGDMGIDKGKVEADFPIKNTGSETLKLYNITTSCMCTLAHLTINSVDSPSFRMGDRSDYVADVAPGSTATLKVVFDPAFHGPNGVGPVQRQAIVETNDPQNSKLEFSMSGTVVR